MKTTPKLWLGVCMAAVAASTGSYAQMTNPALVRASTQVPRSVSSLSRIKILVQQAIDHSPQVREAAANWRAAQSDVAQAEGGLWPRLELGANSSAVTAQGNNSNAMNGGMSATLSYNVYDFGRVRSQIQARQFQSASLRDKFRMAREDAAYATASAYLQLLKYQRTAEIHNQYIADMQSLVDKLTEIVWVFPGRRSELTQAQTRLGQAKDGLAAVRSKISEFQLTLLRLTGTPAPQVQGDVLSSLMSGIGAALADEARSNHPAVVAARAEASAARALAREADASLKPQTDLQMVKQSGQDLNGLSNPTRLFLTAKWVAFDGYSTKANVQAQQERARAAEERGEEIVQEILFNIGSATSDYEIQSSRLRDLTQLVKNTDQVRKDYYDQWRELGRRSLLDVLTAENEHLTTQINLVSSEVDQRLAVVRMRHEAGNFAEWLPTVAEAPVVALPNPAVAAATVTSSNNNPVFAKTPIPTASVASPASATFGASPAFKLIPPLYSTAGQQVSAATPGSANSAAQPNKPLILTPIKLQPQYQTLTSQSQASTATQAVAAPAPQYLAPSRPMAAPVQVQAPTQTAAPQVLASNKVAPSVLVPTQPAPIPAAAASASASMPSPVQLAKSTTPEPKPVVAETSPAGLDSPREAARSPQREPQFAARAPKGFAADSAVKKEELPAKPLAAYSAAAPTNNATQPAASKQALSAKPQGAPTVAGPLVAPNPWAVSMQAATSQFMSVPPARF